MRRFFSLTLLLMGCGTSNAPLPASPALVCAVNADCEESELCSFGGVSETAPEPGDEGVCVSPSQVIGHDPVTWSFQSGGRPLADRLCTAQGIYPGVNADEKRERAKELMKLTGVRMIRLDLTWSQLEPKQGEYDFSAYDPMIDASIDAGLEVIAILAYGVPWATTATEDDDKFPPDDPKVWAAHAAAVAKHYAGKIRIYELWNEPNGGYRFFRPSIHGDAAHYADMLVAASASVREACPECTIYSAGLFYPQQVVNGAIEFTHDMLNHRSDALDGIDRFAFHPYPTYPPEIAPELDASDSRSIGGMVQDMIAVQELHGVTPGILAMTEIGWPSFGALTETEQARYLVRSMLLGASLGMDPLCWFTLLDGPLFGNFPPEDDFGLFRYGSGDPSKPIEAKPSLAALAWLSKLGNDSVPRGANDTWHDVAVGQFALDFESPSGIWTAIWQTADSRTITLDGKRDAFDLSGTLISSAAESVVISESVVYLVPPS